MTFLARNVVEKPEEKIEKIEKFKANFRLVKGDFLVLLLKSYQFKKLWEYVQYFM
jgi:hypothetical protein